MLNVSLARQILRCARKTPETLELHHSFTQYSIARPHHRVSSRTNNITPSIANITWRSTTHRALYQIQTSGNLTSRVDSGFGRFAPTMCNVAETTTGTNGKRFVRIVAVRPLRRRRGVNSLGNRLSCYCRFFRLRQR